MKRIWFTQQKPLMYLSLRMGLGLATDKDAAFALALAQSKLKLCPKIYTTRTHPLSGEYYVVEGSRFNAVAVEPRTEFQVTQSCELDLKEGLVTSSKTSSKIWAGLNILSRNGFSFSELDLGWKGATFAQLKEELLKLNPKATIDTPFYVNLLEPIRSRQSRLEG